MKSRNLKAMLFGAAFAASLTFVGAQPQMPLFPALEVHAASYQDVELDSKYDFEKAFQKALDVARDSEDKNTIYRIKIPAGTYKAGSCFNVYSNTYIDMEGVTLIRTSGSSMFRFGRSEDVKKISGYTGFKNITFHGGTIDGQGAQHGYKSTLLRFAHASDVTIENMTLTNTYSSHSIEFAAAQNVTINKFEYVPRSSGTSVNGIITKYKLLYSTTESGNDFKELTSGEWDADKTVKTATFAPTEMRRIQIRALATLDDTATKNQHVTAAEFNAYKYVANTPVMTDTDALWDAVLAAQKKDLSVYTDASVQAYQAAITAAKAKLALEAGACTPAVEKVIEANTLLSGIGFESGGLAGAHAIHNGFTVLDECHHMYHGEKVAFGTITQLVLENIPAEELEDIIDWCIELGLPVTLKELGITEVTDEKLMAVATAACAENDTLHNMPFEVTPETVCAAIKAAVAYGKYFLGE